MLAKLLVDIVGELLDEDPTALHLGNPVFKGLLDASEQIFLDDEEGLFLLLLDILLASEKAQLG